MTEIELKELAWKMIEAGSKAKIPDALVLARSVFLFFDPKFFERPRHIQMKLLRIYQMHAVDLHRSVYDK